MSVEDDIALIREALWGRSAPALVALDRIEAALRDRARRATGYEAKDNTTICQRDTCDRPEYCLSVGRCTAGDGV